MSAGVLTRSSRRRLLLGRFPGLLGAVGIGFGLAGYAAVLHPQSVRRWQWAPSVEPTASTPPATLALRGVTVVDVVTGQLHADQTVVIAGSRIRVIGPGRRVRVPAGAQVIDAPGKYLIPGLWDMHVHMRTESVADYALFLAYGVTGVRNMGGENLDSVVRWRRLFAAGQLVGPRVLTPGPLISKDGGGLDQGGHPMSMAVRTPMDARRVVDSLKAAGVDFLKVRDNYQSPSLPRETFFALAAEARRVGLPVTGHQPQYVTMTEAADSGMRSIEHWETFFDACWRWKWQYSQPPNFVAAAWDSVVMSDSVPGGEAQCQALAATFRRRGTWLTPTVAVRLPDTLETEQMQRALQVYREHVGWMVRRADRFGMPLLAGSDKPIGSSNPPQGRRLQRELQELAVMGLRPLTVLQAATLNPARYLKATDSLGTVEAGKLADLVLLADNPLEDIRNTTHILAVMANGRYFDRAALEAILTHMTPYKPPR